jgi:hypothetical protein
MNNLAVTLKDQGWFEDVAAMRREVLAEMRRILGDDHLNHSRLPKGKM